MVVQPPYPRNIPLLKGALVSVDSEGRQTVVQFQYNPETLRRSLRLNTVGGDQGNRSQAVRFTGAPVETLSVEVHLDAIDQLDAGDPVAEAQGIYPQLWALELLAYPSSQQVEQYARTLAGGGVSVLPLTAPRTIFVWGPHRVVPIRLTSVSVVEEQFDADLNPVRATVSLEAHVLSYSDVFSDNPDYSLFLAHQKRMEQVARQAQGRSLSGTGLSRLEEG